MTVNSMTVKIDVKKTGKITTWLYSKALVLLASLRLISLDAAKRRLGQRLLNTIYYRVGKRDWIPLSSAHEIKASA